MIKRHLSGRLKASAPCSFLKNIMSHRLDHDGIPEDSIVELSTRRSIHLWTNQWIYFVSLLITCMTDFSKGNGLHLLHACHMTCSKHFSTRFRSFPHKLGIILREKTTYPSYLFSRSFFVYNVSYFTVLLLY